MVCQLDSFLYQHFYTAWEVPSVSEKSPIQIPRVPPAGESIEMKPQSLVTISASLRWNLRMLALEGSKME
jgi:hypothetical protein